ncbi:hypothetical protein GobsT_63970 [Gemmata obscuriglobus]|uniref:Uncharacterized protein n=1 Tax=Gemmata obscuriglobus TaxID=114 RepID=A0A2Z3GYE7_9BACT|nr:hypothetical protein [Gemmata obscuriglobus]AWM35875.1 hypothetical protein C1280_01815 [Gemmata obscuriglobus]QEG31575.1 hypothetical protein GobsT_63970 [Gemmata obscuriglobus]VTS10917.1 unnamed protein product [Gemmata obscuriglobus UQM 2246]
MAEPQATEYPTREWLTDRFADVQFTHRVPAVKWAYFTQLIRPLAGEAAGILWSALFAGVGRPFHPRLARGWMGELFKRGPRSRGSDFKHGELLDAGLCSRLGWASSAPVFLVFQPTQVYVAPWSVWLDCFRRSWVPFDTSVLCSDSSSKVAVFWEGFGPYFADRGARSLAEPSAAPDPAT